MEGDINGTFGLLHNKRMKPMVNPLRGLPPGYPKR